MGAIRKLKLPESGRKIYFDDTLPGFGLRVSKKHKSFVVLYGMPRRLKSLGRFPDIGLAAARQEAKLLLANRVIFQSQVRYPEAVQLFLSDCEIHNRPSTVKSYRHYLKVFETKKRISDITRQDIQHHRQRYKQKPSGYSHSLTTFKIFFNWCLRKEILDRHPIAGERSIATPSRERVLLPEEIQAVWAYDCPHFSTILKLCLLTGQRRSEIAGIEQDWIAEYVLTFPANFTKNKRRHVIPISLMVLRQLDEIPFGQNGNPWNGWSNGKRRIDKFVDIPHWTIHDLRRTFSTIHAEIGTPIHITEKLLNHASGSVSGVVGVYNRYSYLDEMKQSQEKYENCLMNIVKS